MVRPRRHSPRRNGRRLWCRGFDSSLTWDFRWRVSPRDWIREVMMAVVTPRVIGPADMGIVSIMAPMDGIVVRLRMSLGGYDNICGEGYGG